MTEMNTWIVTVALLVGGPATASAQTGPEVPCTNCDARTEFPWPVSGPWINSDTDGSGFLFEVQNGTIAGWYFGYDETGDPQWYLFNSPLVEGMSDDVLWQAEVDLLLFDGGNCINCPWQNPGAPEVTGSLKIEFFQKNHGRFQFGDAEPEFMVPLLFGSAGKAHFPEDTDYVFPDLGFSDDEPGRWVLVSTDNSGDEAIRTSDLVHFRETKPPGEGFPLESLFYRTVEPALSLANPNPSFASISCGPDFEFPELICRVTVNVRNQVGVYMNYKMPVANLGANRFFAEDENGNTVEGFRIGYD